jgi:hypothetical protein
MLTLATQSCSVLHLIASVGVGFVTIARLLAGFWQLLKLQKIAKALSQNVGF